MNRTAISLLAAAALSPGLAFAQSPPEQQSAPVAAAAMPLTSAAVTDDELAKFATATIQIHAIASPDQTQMASAIEGAGLSVDRYNAIASLMQSDTAFQARANKALIAAQTPAATAPTTQTAQASQPALPPLPTSGDGVTLLQTLQQVCIPMVHDNQQVSAVGPKAGLRKTRDGAYAAPLGSKPFSVSVSPRGANPNVCSVTLQYRPGEGVELVNALNAWAARQSPQMLMQRNDFNVGADGLKRITDSWEGAAGTRTTGLVFVRTQKPDGSPLKTGVASATMLYSERGA